MGKRLRSIITAAALLITLWLILPRLHIVFWVQMPWWGFLITAVLLFLAIDYLLGRIFERRP
jgi:hypothetical protein